MSRAVDPVEPTDAPSPPEAAPTPSALTRAGDVAIIGRPNVGKSTFLNAALDVELAITSKTPQTTRTTLLGIVHRELPEGGVGELRLIDTPGLHDSNLTALNRRMNHVARTASESADVVVLMVDVPQDPKRPLSPHPIDLEIAKGLDAKVPLVLVINKIDRLRDKAKLLTLMEAWSKSRRIDALVPIAAVRANGVNLVLDEVAKLLPAGTPEHGPDDFTDKPMRYFAAEYVREQILRRAREEVPHAATVSVDLFEETEKRATISATIHVERLGQKKILVGEKGSMLKQIGTDARKRIAELLGRPVHLELFVRETPGWRDNPRLLEELGYGEGKEAGESKSAPSRRKKQRS